MFAINYILLILTLSWPVLIVGYVLSWLILGTRRSFGIPGILVFVLVSLVLFVAVDFAATLAWLPQFGPPTLYPYVFGPALVAGVIVFPVMWWWVGRRKS